MARTTIDIDDTVLAELKRRRAEEGKPLGVLASELLAQSLSRTSGHPADLVWTSRSMRARLDLEDKDAVWRAVDRR